MLEELHASYTAKLPGLYEEKFELGYWSRYAEGERNTINGLKLSSEDGLELTYNTELVELVREEARVRPVPTREGPSEVASIAGEEA